MVGLGRAGERLDQVGQQRVERGARLGPAQAADRLAPLRRALGEALAQGGIDARRAARRRRALAVAEQAVVARGDRAAQRAQFGDQRGAVGEPVEPRDAVERGGIGRQRMGLPVVDHLQPVLDRAQAVVGLAEALRILGGDDPLGRERVERGAGAAMAQRGQAAAVDQLVRLGEELDLANPAAAALDVEARAGLARAAIGLADARGQAADLLDRGEVEVAAPDERADRGEELARRRRCRPRRRARG